jgi:hypothetical protein
MDTNKRMTVNVYYVMSEHVRLISFAPFFYPPGTPPEPIDIPITYVLYKLLSYNKVREETSYVLSGYTAYAYFDVPKGATLRAEMERVNGNEFAALSWEIERENADTTRYKVTIVQPEYVPTGVRSNFFYTVRVYAETGYGTVSYSFMVTVNVSVNPITRSETAFIIG